jgi:transposase
MTEPPDKEFYKTIKVPLKHIIKNFEINQPKINDLTIMAHKIVIHTLQFMKMYLINYYNINNKLPTIDASFINCCMKILCKEKATGRPAKTEIKELKDTLTVFYNQHYKQLQLDELEYTHMNTILDYLSISIITDYENNIKCHYVEYIERYVNVIWKKKFIIEKIRKIKKTKKEKDDSINRLNSDLRKIKNDLLNVENTNFKSKSFYHKWIKEQKKLILPIKEFKKSNLYYDIQCVPMDYLPKMIYMMKLIEKEELTINNPFPLRTNIIPKHIRIDTTILVHTLLTKKYGNKSDYLFKGNLKKNEDKIWKFFFRTERQCFIKPNYSFHHMIETDGISASILLIRKDKVGKRIVSRECKTTSNEKYIDELNDITYNIIKNKKIVAIDPGKCDLIYCVDSDNKEPNKFRYSQDQRRKETKLKKYNKLIIKEKETKIVGKTIIEYETELSKYNKKSLDLDKYKDYVKNKNKINKIIMDFYSKSLFRKLKLNGYINRKRNEQKLIKNFSNKFGDKEDVIVCFGDFEQKKHMKFKEPIKGKGMRTLFRKNGFITYLVDEFRTSCRCSRCEGLNEKFKVMENPKPYRSGSFLVHGLLKCKSCSGVWNRDCNGATNIYKIVKNAINKIDRPSYLCRRNNSDTLEEVSHP